MEVEAEVEVESRLLEAGGRSAEPEVEVRCRSPWVEAEVGRQRLAEVVVPEAGVSVRVVRALLVDGVSYKLVL